MVPTSLCYYRTMLANWQMLPSKRIFQNVLHFYSHSGFVLFLIVNHLTKTKLLVPYSVDMPDSSVQRPEVPTSVAIQGKAS